MDESKKEALFNVLKYNNYLLCLFEIDLIGSYYFKTYLNALIIEFFKLGSNMTFLSDLEPKELLKELNNINNVYFKELLRDEMA